MPHDMNTIRELDNSRKKLNEELKTHKTSSQCTGEDDCNICKGIKNRIKEIDSIANEGWSYF